MLIIFKFLIYAFVMNERRHFNAIFVLNGFFWRGDFYILSISPDIIGFRVPTQKLRDFPLSKVSHPSHILPPPYVPLQQIQFAVTLTSSEGKLSHLLIFHIISLFL
jgi:hypothetical protein